MNNCPWGASPAVLLLHLLENIRQSVANELRHIVTVVQACWEPRVMSCSIGITDIDVYLPTCEYWRPMHLILFAPLCFAVVGARKLTPEKRDLGDII